MGKYKYLLFDADDTLLDFEKSETYAIKKVYEYLGIEYSEEKRMLYGKINKNLWVMFEKGEIPKSEISVRRFKELSKSLGVEFDYSKVEEFYKNELRSTGYTIDGAIQLCKNLYKDYELYIVTNGIVTTQFGRLKNSGLENYVKDVFVSERVGFQKPSYEYFKIVFESITNIDLSKTIIIGDSLSSDIKGGNNAGIDTCWYNPKKKENKTGIIPKYEIDKLEEIYKIIQ